VLLDAPATVAAVAVPDPVAPVAVLLVLGDDVPEHVASASTALRAVGYDARTVPVPSPALEMLLAEDAPIVDVVVAFGLAGLPWCRRLTHRHPYAARVLALDEVGGEYDELRHAVRLVDAVIAPPPIAATLGGVSLRAPVVERAEEAGASAWWDVVAVAASQRMRLLERAGW
jgi:hypothetical protein